MNKWFQGWIPLVLNNLSIHQFVIRFFSFIFYFFLTSCIDILDNHNQLKLYEQFHPYYDMIHPLNNIGTPEPMWCYTSDHIHGPVLVETIEITTRSNILTNVFTSLILYVLVLKHLAKPSKHITMTNDFTDKFIQADLKPTIAMRTNTYTKIFHVYENVYILSVYCYSFTFEQTERWVYMNGRKR